MPIYPIGFPISESRIVSSIPNKTKLIAHIIPGDVRTYIFDKEDDYYNDYRISWFGLTKCKGGWDCMRHYEILANGCIPWFENLDKCPANTMTFFPKKLILQIMDEMPKNNNGLPDESRMTETHYSKLREYIAILLVHTRKYLTTTAMAKYVLDITGHSDAKRVLFLSGRTDPDYLRCLMLTGFKELLGKDCHDYGRVEHIYTEFPESRIINLYGKGMTYTRNVSMSETRDASFDNNIEESIVQHKYDIVIYGNMHRGTPLWNLVSKYYNSNEIIMLCGEDLHQCNAKDYNNSCNVHLFVREQ